MIDRIAAGTGRNGRLRGWEAGLTAVFVLIAAPAFASCPVVGGATLVVRSPGGNLLVDTSGVSTVEVELTNKTIQIREVCGRDTVEIEGVAAAPFRAGVDWNIRVPKFVNLEIGRAHV